jgi:endonuclease G
MKSTKLFAAVLGLLVLASCGKDHENGGDNEKQVILTPATFTATIAQHSQTRAVDTSWDANDKIGITGTSGEAVYTNVPYITTEGNGNFAPVNDDNIVAFTNDDAVNFTAYHPWKEGATSVINVSTADQNNQKSFDYLFGTGTGNYNNPQVKLYFNHVMAKVVITLKAGAEVTYDELKAAVIKLDGIILDGTFNVNTGATAIDQTKASETITLSAATTHTERSDSQTVEYVLILFPQQLGKSVDMTFVSGTNTFVTTLTLPDNNTIQEKTQYTVNVTLNKTNAIVNGCEIADWDMKVVDDLVAD